MGCEGAKVLENGGHRLPPTVCVLCGGQGTRLRPSLGLSVPKCLAPVGGRPFLCFVLDHLVGRGVEDVVLLTGHLADAVESFFQHDSTSEHTTRYRSARVWFSREASPLGTGGAVRHALPLIKSNPFVVVNGDTWCPFDLQWLLQVHCGGGWDATALLAPPPGREPETSSTAQLRWYTGVTALSKRTVEHVWLPPSYSLENWVLPQVARLNRLREEWSGFRWLDIGTPENYGRAEEFLRTEGVI